MSQLRALPGSKVVALAGAAVVIGGGAAVASPATTILEVVPASGPGEIAGSADEGHADPSDADPSEADASGTGERSDVARDVHRALAGDLAPGDAGFGRAVSANARQGGNGTAASSAARAANGSADRGHGPRNGNTAGDTADAGVGAAAQGRGPDGAGPPPHAAKREGR